ncbi:hypothetical protein KMW28_09125 [Flammeovirga yaeyamensis]|uniref:Lipoprotein n=1 Tax=Flammeovirga yaeyamensis TaxID=367791 RepID=A0AAX1N8Z3_9BACT|nr:hypothetical protein [Flammeovirga yaeyamensis]MBB3698881.1 hypothetical protein [Flammeovirga yaeyamensis]NMF37465.1 hypothetical protein [Flammeovirga yaeyamensis]QWG03722.1 hypothetical protein KMW28_09125 [Flammeovirga yaeyamensis]
MYKNYLPYLTLPFLLWACQNPIEGITLDVSADVFEQRANVQFFDPTDQSKLDGTDKLTVEVLGDDASKILNDGGEPELSIVDGILSMVVNPLANQEEPVSVILKVSGEGYLTTTIPLTIEAEDSTVFLSANLVNLENAPEGVNVTTASVTLINNAVSSDFNVTTTPSSEGQVSTKVTIPAGTTFFDADGNPISGSDLSLTAVNFDASSQSALSSFPGGFSPVGVLDEEGNMRGDIDFATAGFASIDMFIGETEVKGFSQPIQITTQVNASVMNPDTQEQIKAGDEVPIWSYSRDDGTWEYHSTETVTNNNGNLEVNYSTDHLSWYNLDFYGIRCSKYIRVYSPNRGRWWWPYTWQRNPNYAPTNINISASDYPLATNGKRVLMSVVWAGTNQPISYWATKNYTLYDGQSINLLNAPANRPLQMVVFSGRSRRNPGEILYRSSSFTSCANAQVSVDLNQLFRSLPDYVNVDVNYIGYCGDRTVRRSQSLYIYDDQGYYRWAGWIRRGYGRIYNVELNKNYKFKIYYKRQTYEFDMTFTSTNMSGEVEIPQEICGRFF